MLHANKTVHNKQGIPIAAWNKRQLPKICPKHGQIWFLKRGNRTHKYNRLPTEHRQIPELKNHIPNRCKIPSWKPGNRKNNKSKHPKKIILIKYRYHHKNHIKIIEKRFIRIKFTVKKLLWISFYETSTHPLPL